MKSVWQRLGRSWAGRVPPFFSTAIPSAWPSLIAGMPAWLRIVVCTGALLLTQSSVSPRSYQDFIPTIIAAHTAELEQWADIYPLPTPEGNEAFVKVWYGIAAQHQYDMSAVGPFTYHPYYLSAARPLVRRFSVDQLCRGLVLANRVATALVAFELAAMLSLTGLAGQLLLTLLLAACSPVVSALNFGQNTVIALALAITTLRLWAHQRGAASLVCGAVLAAMAMACKPWAVLLLAFCFVFRTPLAALASVGSVLAVMFGLPFFVYPKIMMTHYTAFAAELSRTTVPGVLNLSLQIALERVADPALLGRLDYFGPIAPTPVLRHATLALTALCALLAGAAMIRRRPPADWICAAGLGLMLLPFCVAWTHYFVFALPIAILASAAAHDSKLLRCAALGLLAQLVLLEHWLFTAYDRSSPWPLLLPIASVAGVSVWALWVAPARPQQELAPIQ